MSSTWGGRLTWTGWLVAAALVLAFGLSGREIEPDFSISRTSLIATASDLVHVEWARTEDPSALQASGDVVWSSSLQEGYMLFNELAPNDPEENQYQLWIFDRSRVDWEAKPVDGGVFNVTGNGNVVVPIDPKLAVSEAVLFAVTVEIPGGVVVSERDRLVLTATPQ